MKIGEYFVNYERTEKNRKVIVIASSIPLKLSEHVSPGGTYEICADEVVVDRPINLEGGNVRLVCNELTFVDGASLDSTGAEGISAPPSQAVGPQEPGSNGATGMDGEPGQHGGDISIFCYSSTGKTVLRTAGGKGGRGQDGGDGIGGSDGPDGTPAVYFNSWEDEPPGYLYSGTNGKPGGMVGLPGINGRGGMPGQLVVKMIDAPADFVCERRTGDSGANANPGKFGMGGAPGKFGILYRCNGDITSPPLQTEDVLIGGDSTTADDEKSASTIATTWGSTYTVFSEDRRSLVQWVGVLRDGPTDPPGRGHRVCNAYREGAHGERGKDGDKREHEVAQRQQFKLGDLEKLKIESVSPKEIGSAFTPTCLELVVTSLEDQFKALGLADNSNTAAFEKFVKKVIRYMAITEELGDGGSGSYFGRLCSMARKIQLGFDFFGFTAERVPLLSMNAYKELLDRSLLVQVRFIEEQFNTYVERLTNNESELKTLQNIRDTASGHLVTLTGITQTLEQEINQQLLNIPKLNLSVQDAYAQLLKGKDVLDQAFKKKTNGGCGVSPALITAAVLVVAVVATGGSALAVAGAGGKFINTWNENNKSASTLWDAKSLLADDLKQVASKINDVTDGITKIQNAYNQLNQEQKTASLPALSISRADFDKIASDFADMPEAKEYRDLGYAYLDRVEARNKTVIDYNSQLVRLSDLYHQRTAASNAIKGADAALQNTLDFDSGEVYTRIMRLRRATLHVAARIIHAQEKALGYHLCKQVAPRVQSGNAAELAAAHANVLNSWITAKETAYVPIRKLIPNALRIPLRLFSTPQDWKRFVNAPNSKVLPLNINPRSLVDDPNSILLQMPGLRMTGATLTLDGITAGLISPIKWELAQDGNEKLIAPDGGVVTFNKVAGKPLTGFVTDTPIVNSDSSEEGLYSGVSIFANWILILSGNFNGVDFKKIKNIVLSIDGYYLG